MLKFTVKVVLWEIKGIVHSFLPTPIENESLGKACMFMCACTQYDSGHGAATIREWRLFRSEVRRLIKSGV